MNKPRKSLAIALGAVALCIAAYSDQPEKLDLPVQQWREDLQYLARTLPTKHANAFHFTSKERFESGVADLDRQLDHLNSDEIVVGMAKIIALVGDGHTHLGLPRDSADFPINFVRFGADLRVVAAAPGLEQALGARVIKVQDTPVERASELAYQMFSQDENPTLAESYLADSLTTGIKLHGLGIIPDRNTVQYTLAGPDGKEFTIQVHALAPGQRGNDLVQASKEIPLRSQRPEEHFWCTYLADVRTLYCNVRLIRDLKEPAKEMLKLVQQNKPEKLVVDLRQNPGGDFNVGLKYLVHPIRDLPAINKKGHLFVLIGPRTFSAAMSNATHFRYQTEALLVGRTIGEKPNSYQESRGFFLPNSHISVRYSVKFYKFVDSGENMVKPDQEVASTWEDYMAGRDPALDWILKYVPESQAQK
jgi:hypothetical protein